MSARDKNLLEAFQGLHGARPQPAQPAAPPSAQPPAERRAPPRDEPRRPDPGAETAPRRRLVLDNRLALEIVAVLVAFSLGVLFDHAVRQAAAADEARPAEQEVLTRAPGADVAEAGRWPTPAGAAEQPSGAGGALAREEIPRDSLFHPDNHYTIQTITYNAGPTWEGYAEATYEYLRSQGLPAFPPVKSGGHLVLLVGAAPTGAALESLATRVRALKGPNGQFPFSGAIVLRKEKLDIR